MELDKITAGSIDFVFGMNSSSSIGIVNLSIPLGMIIFILSKSTHPFYYALRIWTSLQLFSIISQIKLFSPTTPIRLHINTVTLFYFGVLQLIPLLLSHICKTFAALLILSYVLCIAALNINQSNVSNKS